jgi:hypothetical protein
LPKRGYNSCHNDPLLVIQVGAGNSPTHTEPDSSFAATMTKALRTLLPLLLLAGCSVHGTIGVIDVTNDPRFAGGYEPGQVWRLRTDGYIVHSGDNGLELWKPADAAGLSDTVKVPAGSTVRIQRLGYLFNSEHPPTAGSTSEMIWAYGTLTDPGGKQWQVSILPAIHDGRPVPGTSLFVYPPDRQLLEAVGQ